MCGVHLQKWRKAVFTGFQATCIKNAFYSGFCGFLAIWAIIKLRAVWDRGVFQTSLPIPCLYPPFCGSKWGIWKSWTTYTWLGNRWLIPAMSLWKQMLEEATHRVLNKFTSLYSCSEKKKKIQSYSRHFLKTSGLFIKLVQIPSHSIHFEIKRCQNVQAEVSAKDLGPGCSVGCSQAAWCPKGFDAKGHIADDGSSQLAPDSGAGLCHSLSSRRSWMASWVPSEMQTKSQAGQ